MSAAFIRCSIKSLWNALRHDQKDNERRSEKVKVDIHQTVHVHNTTSPLCSNFYRFTVRPKGSVFQPLVHLFMWGILYLCGWKSYPKLSIYVRYIVPLWLENHTLVIHLCDIYYTPVVRKLYPSLSINVMSFILLKDEVQWLLRYVLYQFISINVIHIIPLKDEVQWL